jgi:hypothetical protein
MTVSFLRLAFRRHATHAQIVCARYSKDHATVSRVAQLRRLSHGLHNGSPASLHGVTPVAPFCTYLAFAAPRASKADAKPKPADYAQASGWISGLQLLVRAVFLLNSLARSGTYRHHCASPAPGRAHPARGLCCSLTKSTSFVLGDTLERELPIGLAMSSRSRILIFYFSCIATLTHILLAGEAQAVPSFARKYQTSCLTCHTVYPVLNPFGEAFRRNGYRFPQPEGECRQ